MDRQCIGLDVFSSTVSSQRPSPSRPHRIASKIRKYELHGRDAACGDCSWITGTAHVNSFSRGGTREGRGKFGIEDWVVEENIVRSKLLQQARSICSHEKEESP